MKRNKYIDYSHIYFYFAPSVFMVTKIGAFFNIPVLYRLMRIFYTPFIYFWMVAPFVLWAIMILYERPRSIKRSKEVNSYRMMSIAQPVLVILTVLYSAIVLIWFGSPI